MGCSCGKATAVSEVVPAAGNAKPEPSSGQSASSKGAPQAKAAPVSADVLSKKISQAASTRVLPLRECGLKSLPPDAVDQKQSMLRTADLSENALVSLPESISIWSALQNLLCAGNALEGLPNAVGQLVSLQKLVLTSNQIRGLPSSLPNLGKLRILALDSNKLDPKLFDVFSGSLAASLEDLDLSGNMLKDLPPSLCNLQALTRLILARNELRILPAEIGGLVKLQRLDAAENLLTSVPASVFECASLSELWLKGNPVDRLQLQEMPGFGKFLERRKQRLDSKIDSHVVGAIDLSVCGLD